MLNKSTQRVPEAATQPNGTKHADPKAHVTPLKVAIVYPFVATYRKSVFQLLSRFKSTEYTIISGTETNAPIRTLDPALASTAICEGGFRWVLVNNWEILGRFLWQRGLHREISQRQFDTVIFLGNPYFLSSWLQAIRCRMTGIKVMMWGHGFIRRERGLRGMIRRMFYSLAETHFVYNSRSKRLMLDSGLGHKNVHVINNCLDHDTHVALRATVASGESPYPKSAGRVLVFVGRLTPRKELHLLLRAQALRMSEALTTSIYMIGDGSERDSLEALAKSLGTEQFVHFLGETFDELTIARHLYHADACVSPGEVGLTAIHALSFGTPVISHDDLDHQMPEFESIVDGATGGFFTRGSVSDLAACIERVIHNPEGRSAVRQRCMNLIDRSFTPEYQLYVFERGIREAYKNA